MNIVLLYISPNGTTQKTAHLLSQAFAKHQHQVACINIGKSPYREDMTSILEKITAADLVGFGSAAYHMDMLEPMIRLFNIILSDPDPFHFRTFFFMNYSGITTGKAFLLYARKFQSMRIPVCGAIKIIAPHFHHQMDFPTEGTHTVINSFVKSLEENQYSTMDSHTIEMQLQPFTRKVHLIYPLIHLIGKKRELPISIDLQTCKLCGKCVRECPAGAMVQNTCVHIDFQKCLHCYHCVAACPQKAIQCRIEKLDAMMQTNIKIIGMEQPGNQFYV
jgi:Fe-S-cluster-containing hydrogenase component 2